ncbi:MAG: phosphoethanolamine transferase [Variovorax sp.]|nr:MAG: phosphoethanolamine transferase [Variovorax sp.]
MTLPPEASDSRRARWWKDDTLLSCSAIAATLLFLIALGHDGRRVAQLAVLAAPMLLWLAWPVENAWVHRLRAIAVWSWAMAFALDGAARAYLLDAYQAAPDSAMVLGAAANTNARESAEYLSMHWRSIAMGCAVLGIAGLLVARCARRGVRMPRAQPRSPWKRRAMTAMCALLLLAGALAYASKPWRRLHPLVFWANWAQSVKDLRAGWADQQHARDRAVSRAQAAHPFVVADGPATVVLVITDSINRDNMALYGYDRATTPRLLAHKAQLKDEMLVLKNAWSVDASTLPALRNIFNFGLPEQDEPPHLLAMAKAAGYKVWWISNHDDVAIEQQHARLADVVDMVNRAPGRASASLDGEILDCVQEALQDATAHKLIVVHLMGAHPHYSLRFPPGANPFDDDIDAVEAELENEGRPAWVRRFRQEYDAALLYHDFVVSELLRMTRQTGTTGDYRAWMYLSDHGQEVGHGTDRAGHSPSTASGYRIPAIVWRNRQRASGPTNLSEQPFRADWAAWTLTDLLDIRWKGHDPSRNVLHPGYRWQAPELPMVEAFTR